MKIDWHRIITPGAWVQLGKVNWRYDSWINKKLDEFGVEPLPVLGCVFKANVGNFSIWVSNYPFAFGHPSSEGGGYYTLPSVKTRKRIKRMLEEKEWGND